MTEYNVLVDMVGVRSVTVEANNPREAAKKALAVLFPEDNITGIDENGHCTVTKDDSPIEHIFKTSSF